MPGAEHGGSREAGQGAGAAQPPPESSHAGSSCSCRLSPLAPTSPVNSNFSAFVSPPSRERLPVRPELMSLGGTTSDPFQIDELSNRIRSSSKLSTGRASPSPPNPTGRVGWGAVGVGGGGGEGVAGAAPGRLVDMSEGPPLEAAVWEGKAEDTGVAGGACSNPSALSPRGGGR